jgi:hypothetical protein
MVSSVKPIIFGVKVKRAIKVKELEIKKNNYAKKEVSL